LGFSPAQRGGGGGPAGGKRNIPGVFKGKNQPSFFERGGGVKKKKRAPAPRVDNAIPPIGGRVKPSTFPPRTQRGAFGSLCGGKGKKKKRKKRKQNHIANKNSNKPQGGTKKGEAPLKINP